MRWWKVLGLAGLAGVAATGVVITRAERRRRAYTPEQVRARLRERAGEAAAEAVSGAVSGAASDPDVRPGGSRSATSG